MLEGADRFPRIWWEIVCEMFIWMVGLAELGDVVSSTVISIVLSLHIISLSQARVPGVYFVCDTQSTIGQQTQRVHAAV